MQELSAALSSREGCRMAAWRPWPEMLAWKAESFGSLLLSTYCVQDPDIGLENPATRHTGAYPQAQRWGGVMKGGG